MSDLSSRYAELVADGKPGGLIPPAELRRRADRRARVRAVAAAAGVALVLAGSAATAEAVLIGADRGGPQIGTDPGPNSNPSSGSPSPGTPTPPPAAADPAGVPTVIPEGAFFIQPENTQKGEGPRSADHDGPVLPSLCDANLSSDESIVRRRTMGHLYGLPQDPAENLPHGIIVQTITSYREGAAEIFMTQLGRAVRQCPRGAEGDLIARYALIGATDGGDESLLIQVETGQLNFEGNPAGTAVHQVSVVRVGAVVTVLRDTGWEGTETDPALLDAFTGLAVTAIEEWLG